MSSNTGHHLSIHVFWYNFQLAKKILLFFSLGSLPPSGHSVHHCRVMSTSLFSYLAPPHCFSWLCALFTARFKTSALKTKLLISLWLFILQSECFSDIHYICFHYILGVWGVWLLFTLSRWKTRVQGDEGPVFPLTLCSQLAVFRFCVWFFFLQRC